jgi:hypothetical protein
MNDLANERSAQDETALALPASHRMKQLGQLFYTGFPRFSNQRFRLVTCHQFASHKHRLRNEGLAFELNQVKREK